MAKRGKRGKKKENTFSQRKGQITITIIIGIVMIMIFGIGYFTLGQSVEKKGEQALVSQQKTKELIDPVDEYVTDCLNVIASEGLSLLGKQGGYIFKSQGGPIPDFPSKELGKKYLVFESINVPYSIFRPEGQVGNLFFTDIPRYPFDTFPVVKGQLGVILKTEFFEGFYGESNLPQLLPPYDNSIKYQLEIFTENKISSCVDWQQFKKTGLSIHIGLPNASVAIQEREILFNLNWELTVSSNATSTVAKLERFSVSYPLRFPQLYSVLNYAVSQDINNISFALDNYNAGPITARVYKDIYINDDIVVFEDTSSRIIDKTFKFAIARQDRPPALYYIDPDISQAIIICDRSNISRLDDSIFFDNRCGPALTLDLKAIDPDEDIVSFSFNRQYLNKNETYLLSTVEARGGSYAITITANAHGLKDYQDVLILTRKVA